MHFPVMDIQAIAISAEAKRLLQNLDQVDMLLFISANAVRYGVPIIRQTNSNLASKTIVAIGKATVKALEKLNLDVDIKPQPPYNSEALLILHKMQDVRQTNILIIKGEGGREHLAEQLRKKAATVNSLNVYKRAVPDNDSEILVKQWQQGKINVVTSFSVEALDNLVALLGESGSILLKQTPQVVVSQRMYEHTQKIGITAPVMVADEASDEAVVAALVKLIATLPRNSHE